MVSIAENICYFTAISSYLTCLQFSQSQSTQHALLLVKLRLNHYLRVDGCQGDIMTAKAQKTASNIHRFTEQNLF